MKMALKTRLLRILKARLRRVTGGFIDPVTAADAGDVPPPADRPSGARRATAGVERRREELLAVLELPPRATAEEIRSAYRKLCKRYHPDRFSSRPEKASLANELLREINRAYEELRGS